MTQWIWKSAGSRPRALARWGAGAGVGALLAIAGGWMMSAQQPPADLVLTNGKIITVDDRFSIAQAVAVRGDRIIAVGTSQEINRLAGPDTRRIDLRGRAVTPGLIDNHAHYQEEGAYWILEKSSGRHRVAQAGARTDPRARAGRGRGQWVYTLGGWSPDQFADDPRPFTRDELDKVAPNNPVFLQFTREETYVNSRAIEATGMDKINEPWVERDAAGRPTGVIKGDAGTAQIRNAAGFLKNLPKDIFEQSSMTMLRDLSRAGLTASGGACQFEDIYRQWQQQNRLSMRFFCLQTATAVAGGTERGRGHRADPEAPLFRRRRVDRPLQLGRAAGQHAGYGQRRQADRAARTVGELGPDGARRGEGGHPDLHPHDHGMDG